MKMYNVHITAEWELPVQAKTRVEAESLARQDAIGELRSTPTLGRYDLHVQAGVGQVVFESK